jgi:hypothetical protein
LLVDLAERLPVIGVGGSANYVTEVATGQPVQCGARFLLEALEGLSNAPLHVFHSETHEFDIVVRSARQTDTPLVAENVLIEFRKYEPQILFDAPIGRQIEDLRAHLV